MSAWVMIYLGFMLVVAAAVVVWRLLNPGCRCWLSAEGRGTRLAAKLIFVACLLLAGTIYVICHWAQATAQGG